MKEIQVIGAKKRNFAEEAIVRYPWLVNPLLQGVSAFLSPFDHHLGIHVMRWEERSCELKVPSLRRLRDVRTFFHPGVLSSAGERAAFFLVNRHFPFWKYELTLREINTVIDQETRKRLFLRCEFTFKELADLERELLVKDTVSFRLKTDIFLWGTEKSIAQVRTSWILQKRKWIWDQWKR